MKKTILRFLIVVFLLVSGFSTVATAAVDFREESIYFLLTTRFFDGDSSNNRPNEWCSYDADSDTRQITDPNDVTWRGDFKGLMQKLDYIKDLGFTAIWITPIVQNRGPLDYHGYHAWDFTKVDPRLESPGATFQDLVNAVHAKGMKIVLDVVFNHSGRFGVKGQCEIKYNTDPNESWGQDSSGNALQANPNWEYDGLTANPDDGKIWSRANVATMPSPYNDDLSQYNWPSTQSFVDTTPSEWYHHSGNGFAQGWDDTENLYNRALAGDCPDLNTESTTVRNYLVAAYKQYIDMGVDAFRVDTVKHMDRATVQYFTDAFHAINPDLFIFGEVAQKRHELHSVEEINPHWYTWRGEVGNSENSGMAVLDFYEEATFHSIFEEGQNMSGVTAAARYDHLYSDASYNVSWLDNHDFGPNNDWNSRFGGSAENLAAAMNFMFTWRGIPSVYYGTEMQFMKGTYADLHDAAGIEKSINVTGRAYYGDTMSQAPSHKVYQQIKKLNAMRKAIPALQKGTWSWGGNGGGNGVGYIRDAGSSYAVVGLAKDGTVDFSFSGVKNGNYVDAVTGESVTVSGGNLSFTVSASSAGIYVLNGTGIIGDLGAGYFQTDGNGSSNGGSTTTNDGSVTFSPASPVIGQSVTVTYNMSMLKDKDSVTMHWACDGWSVPAVANDTLMVKQADGSWTATVTVPATATLKFDGAFFSGTEWDNNNDSNYHADLTQMSTDIVAPIVSLTAPIASSTVSGTISITADASDNVGVSKVEFYVGTSKIGEDVTAPYSFSYDTKGVANGSVVIKAKAYDAAGNSADSSATVNVNNVVLDTTAPTVSFTINPATSPVNGTIAVAVTATDNVAVSSVQLYCDGSLIASDITAPYSFSFDSTSVSDATHQLKVEAVDSSTNKSSVTKDIVVKNGQGIVTKKIHYYSTVKAAATFIQYKTATGAFNSFPGTRMTSQANNWYLMQKDMAEGSLLARFIFSGGRWDNNSGSNYTISLNEVWIKDGVMYDHDPTSSNQAPVVNSLTVPTGNISGTVTFTADASDDVAVVKVEFYVDGGKIGEDTTAPYSISYDTSALAGGAHAVKAVAYDAAGLVGEKSGSFTITVFDNPPVVTTLTVPSGSLTGSVTISAEATDDKEMSKVEFYVNGNKIGEDITAPYSVTFDSATLANGSYTVKAIAYDVINQTGDKSGSVTILHPVTGVKVVHYYTSWSSAYIHYNNGDWTAVPGEVMNNDGNGWFSKAVTSTDELIFVFNDGSGNWDNNNSADYSTTASEIWVKDGVILLADPELNNGN